MPKIIPRNIAKLDNIPDVNAGSPSDNDALTWDNATNKWIPEAVAAGGQILYDAIVAPSGGDYTLLSAALTAGKTNIFVRNGTYSETSDIDLSASNISITGESRDNTIIDFAINTQLDFNNKSDIVVYNLTFTGGNGLGTVRMVGTGNKLINLIIDGDNTNVRIEGYNNILSGCEFVGSAAGVRIQSGGNNIIEGCWFDESSLTILSGANENIIIGCNIFDSGNTITCSSNRNFIVGCRLGDDLTNQDGRLACTGDQNIIANNQFIRGRAGIEAIDITGNGNMVSGNIINGATSAYPDGIFCSGDNNIIKGNFITNSSSNGINISGSGALENMVEGNYLTGNTSSPIVDTGTGTTILNNYPTDIIQDEKRFIQMKNTSGGQLVQGDLATLKAVAAGNEITTTTAQGDDLVFAMVDATIADAATGRVQILGKTTKLKVDGTVDIAIGDFIGTFTSAGIGMKAAAGDMSIAIALEAYATDDSAGVIDALLITPRKI